MRWGIAGDARSGKGSPFPGWGYAHGRACRAVSSNLRQLGVKKRVLGKARMRTERMAHPCRRQALGAVRR